MKAAIGALVALQLGGCAIVVVKADDGPPRLSAWPLGVKVERGRADAIGVRQIGVGLSLDCIGARLGAWSSKCVVIDDQACTAVIVDGPANPAARGILSKIAETAELDCLAKQGNPK